MKALTQVQEQAHAKINLSLDVLRKRVDGYHEVRMIMQSLALCDEVTLTRIPAEQFQKEAKEEKSGTETMAGAEPAEQAQPIRLHITEAQGQAEGSLSELPADASNLMWRAAALLREHCGISDGVALSLTKRIPVAAGLAGGSTDAAAVLRGMNRLFALGLSMEELAELGLRLGADVPYCLQGGTMLAEGIGERLSPLPPAPACGVLLVKPKRGVSTAAVYGALQLEQLQPSAHPDVEGALSALARGELSGLCQCLGNLLETVTLQKVPEIKEIEERLWQSGADGVLMSGSGPTVFALFADESRLPAAAEAIRESELAALVSDVIETAFFKTSPLAGK